MNKKISLFLGLLTLAFLINGIGTVHADSGACSYHGGVDCLFGPTSDGNATCADGTESSVLYASMEECWRLPFSCADLATTCSVSARQNVCQAVSSQNGGPGSQYEPSMVAYCPQAVACQDQINLYNKCLSNQQAINQSQQQEQAQQTQDQQGVANQQSQNQQTASCQRTMGANSNYNNGHCYCNSGYMLFNGQCLSSDQANAFCKAQVGPDEYVVGPNNCGCTGGYQKNNQGKCSSITNPTQSTETNSGATSSSETSTPASVVNEFKSIIGSIPFFSKRSAPPAYTSSSSVSTTSTSSNQIAPYTIPQTIKTPNFLDRAVNFLGSFWKNFHLF